MIIKFATNKNNIIEIDDRYQAIKQAIAMLQPNDILIIAGKGHEQYQIIGNIKYSFNESQIINDIIDNC